MGSGSYLWILTGVQVGVSACIFSLVSNVQPEPYMDEIFHIPQARRYCNGKFTEWDDKITTLPGLYLISVGVLNPVSQLLQRLCCDVVHLRIINFLMAGLSLPILHKITLQIHGDKHFYDDFKGLLSSFNLSIFPLFYFFSFLYYTDVGSTFLVLLMYSLHLDRFNWPASFIGLLAILFRQTNVIWVAFMALQAIGPNLMQMVYAKLHQNQKTIKFSLTTWGQTKEVTEGIFLLLKDPSKLFELFSVSIVPVGGYLIVGLGFLLFVLINGGIVVGDRAAHQVNFHPTQIAYFCLFAGCMTWSFCATKAIPFVTQFCRRHYILVAMATLALAGLVNSYTMAHPYLLADNRHYTFYFWRRFVTITPWSKFALVPFYIFFAYCILYSIRRNGIIFKLTFPVCLILNLAPQLLLEFRYFVVPFYLYRLQVRPQTWWKLLSETFTYLVINAITIYLFVERPFYWEHEPQQIQRFIW